MASNGKSGWKKWLFILIALGILAGGVAWYFTSRDKDEVQYQTATVTRGDLTQMVTATGTLDPVTNVTVGSQISGIIQTLNADWNTPVKAGQVVAQLDPATYKANLEQAKADLANSVANQELTQIEATRSDQLFSNELVSASDHDTAIATLHQAQAMVQLKQALVDNAQVNLDRCTIYSPPVDGTVISRNVDIGTTVAASLSAPTIFVIANDLAKMQIDANVSEADIGTVEEGMPVDFTVDAFPDRTFKGKVVQIRNAATTVQNVVTYDVVIGVNNPDFKLRPGMTANASIISARRPGALKVPNAALRFHPPEPGTNKSFFARIFSSGDSTPVSSKATNAVSVSGETNAAAAEPPLTGNEPPQELMRRVREMRDRGEDVPPEIRAKMGELYESGALQRPSGGGGSSSVRSSSQPATRTIYLLTAKAASGDDPAPQPVKVKTGVTDGAFTEILDGLKEGDLVITGVRQTVQASAPAGSANPFGGGGGGGGRR